MERISLNDEPARSVLLIRILDPGASDALAILLGGEDVETAFEARSLCRLQEALERNRPDVIVVDLRLPIQRGVELLRAMTAICPEAEILTRVDSRHPEPRFFSVRSTFRGLSLEPLEREALNRLPRSLHWAETKRRRSPLAEQPLRGRASGETRGKGEEPTA